MKRNIITAILSVLVAIFFIAFKDTGNIVYIVIIFFIILIAIRL